MSEQTPAASKKWFRLAIIFALLYGITFSLYSVFNWIFFLAAVYLFWLDWYLDPNRARIFQGRAFQGGGRQNFGGNPRQESEVTPEQRAKKIVFIIVGSIFGFFVLLFIIGINSDEYEQQQNTDTSGSEELFEDTNANESPSEASTHVSKGNDLFNSGKYDSADLYYDRALALDPEYWEAVYGKGIVLWQNNRKDEANAYLVRAYEGGYRYSWLSWALGDMHDKRNERKEAIALYKESLQMDSAFTEIYTRLAELEPADAGKYQALAEKWKH